MAGPGAEKRGALAAGAWPLTLDLLRAGYLGWAVAELATGDVGAAIGLAVTFAVVWGARYLRLPVALDLALLAALLLQSLGKFADFWHRYPWWDTLVHFALPAAVAPIIYLLAVRYALLPDPWDRLGRRRAALATVVITLMLSTTGGMFYEEYEWASDSWRGSGFQPNNEDTMTDISMNMAGGFLGGMLMAASAAVRRRDIPRREPSATTASSNR